MKRTFSLLLLLLLFSAGAPLLQALQLSAAAQARQSEVYFPGPGDQWERRTPQQVGMNAQLLEEAVGIARAGESSVPPRDLERAHYQSFGREPFGEAVGPFSPRGEPTGIIVRNGYIVAEWGDPHRVDMTFSVTKSFLSTTVGLALDRGLILSVHDPVASYVGPVLAIEPYLGAGTSRYRAERLGEDRMIRPFDTEHNRKITWDHLLRQTSDWEGTLWGKPEWADRPAQDTAEWIGRPRREPGSAYEYNDVRVNVLALAALNVWRRPLPEVLREHVMEPIDASTTWLWAGYDNSWVLMDGLAVQSVSGGGHWGGGMFISARDQARFGYLTLRRGRWGDRQILSEEWVRMALTPTPVQPTYGFMNWFLNTGGKYIEIAPESAFVHAGHGPNLIYVDPEHDLVIVTRWTDRRSFEQMLERVLASIG